MFKKNQFGNLMQKAQKMQENMKKIQQKMKSIIVKGESGAGLVKITLNGEHHCKTVEIDPSLFKEDEKEVIEDLIIAAFNDASRKIKEEQKKKMTELSGIIPFANNLNFPI